MTHLVHLNQVCDLCGRKDPLIAKFARVYRLMELKNGRGTPGNLCGECAGKHTAARIIQDGPTVIDQALLIKVASEKI